MTNHSVTERILLFIPMYNCAKQISRVIAQLTPDIRALFNEILLIDNGSSDGGPQVAAEILSRIDDIDSRVITNDANYGLGGSQKVAFRYAIDHGFDYIVMLHGDDQGSIDDIVPMLREGRHRKVDALLGARFMKGSRHPGYSIARTVGNHVFNAIYSLALGQRIVDLGSGLNLYRVAALRDGWWMLNADDLTFNYHMIVRSVRARWNMEFFPLCWREDDQVSNVKLVSQAVDVARIPIAWLFSRKAYLASDFSRAPERPYSWHVLSEHPRAPHAL